MKRFPFGIAQYSKLILTAIQVARTDTTPGSPRLEQHIKRRRWRAANTDRGESHRAWAYLHHAESGTSLLRHSERDINS